MFLNPYNVRTRVVQTQAEAKYHASIYLPFLDDAHQRNADHSLEWEFWRCTVGTMKGGKRGWQDLYTCSCCAVM